MDRIVVGVDGSQAADRALRWAVAEAARHGALVDLVHAYVLHPYAGMFGEADRELARGRLDEVVERNRTVLDAVKWSATLTAASGAAAAALVDAAADADLAVVGSRGRGGFPRLTLGSTSYRVAAHAQVPVAVVPAASRGDDARRPVLVGIDDAPASRRALRWAVREAQLRSSAVELVHCFIAHGSGPVTRAQEQQLADTRLEAITIRNRDALDRVTWSAATTAVRAVPSSGLIAAAVDADLLVVGARGAEGFHRLRLGSTGYRTAAHSPVPVAVVGADGGGPEEMDVRRPLVVGVDSSPAAHRALLWAVDEARRRSVSLTVAHVYQPRASATPEAEAAARHAAEAIVRGLEDDTAGDKVAVETVVVRGTPAGRLLELSGSDHLLVIGTRGGGPLTDMPFGSVSRQCLHHACGPTVIVP